MSSKARKKKQRQKAFNKKKELKLQLKECQETIARDKRVLAIMQRYYTISSLLATYLYIVSLA